jgi:hypothetical protein
MRPNYRVSSLAALLIACGGTPTESTKERAEQAATQAEGETSCLDATSTSGWVSGGIGAPPSHFTWELDVTPSTTGEDALVGLAHDSPASYSDLAAIVRFNSEGKLDARDGSVYRAVTEFAYEPGAAHHLTFDVDSYRRTYSVLAMRGTQGAYIARDFEYRTEQANADGLSFFGAKVDDGGPLELCNFALQGGACTTANETDGFVNVAFPPQSTFVTLAFDATPSSANGDTVLGVSAQAASGFSDIAAAVRFNPDGRIDARDGDAYRDVDPYAPAYTAGRTYHVELFLDVVGHSYSVVIDRSRIAHGLGFRTSQASVSTLGNFVIKSDSASVTSCGLGYTPARDAVYVHSSAADGAPTSARVIPLPDGRFLSASTTQTMVYDTRGLPSTSLPFSGSLAADAAGNVFRLDTFSGTVDEGTGPLTSAGGQDVVIVRYDAAFQPVWSKRFGGPDDDVGSALTVNARGDVLFVLNGSLVRLDTNGNVVYDSVAVSPGSMVALDPSGNVFTSNDPPVSGALSINKRDVSGAVLWTQVMPFVEGGGNMEGLAADSTGGVVFSGLIQGRFAFPDGSTFKFDAGENGQQTYIAKLDGNGARVYANATGVSYFGALTVDGLGNAAVSGTHVNAFAARIDEYGPTGALVREISGASVLGQAELGFGSAVKADHAGNLYWSFQHGVSTDYGAFFVKLNAP